jgi:glucuronoarabinoxylan endo-1,4-beta-xylanase
MSDMTIDPNALTRVASMQAGASAPLAGGTNDGTVGTFPKEYHELFAQNGTEHIWTEVPGGGHDGSVGTPLFYNFFRAVFKA